jgi:hypothetical protein
MMLAGFAGLGFVRYRQARKRAAAGICSSICGRHAARGLDENRAVSCRISPADQPFTVDDGESARRSPANLEQKRYLDLFRLWSVTRARLSRSWQIDRERYRARLLLSNGQVGAQFELRPLFEQCLLESS